MKKLFFISTIVITSLYGCLATKNNNYSKEFKEIFFYTYVMSVNGVTLRDTFNLYISHHKNYVIYELPYHISDETEDSLLYDSLKFEYFIYNPVWDYGYSFKNWYDGLGKKISKDSMLRKRAVKDIEMSGINKTYKILNKVESNFNDEAIHKYYISDTLTDSAYYYYDKRKVDMKFSLSKTFDSIYKSKLYKVELFYKKGIFSPIGSNLFDGVKMEIKNVPLINLTEIETLINKIEESDKLKTKP